MYFKLYSRLHHPGGFEIHEPMTQSDIVSGSEGVLNFAQLLLKVFRVRCCKSTKAHVAAKAERVTIKKIL